MPLMHHPPQPVSLVVARIPSYLISRNSPTGLLRMNYGTASHPSAQLNTSTVPNFMKKMEESKVTSEESELVVQVVEHGNVEKLLLQVRRGITVFPFEFWNHSPHIKKNSTILRTQAKQNQQNFHQGQGPHHHPPRLLDPRQQVVRNAKISLYAGIRLCRHHPLHGR